nr:SpoIIE family protein phosphatase [uncultured Desulfuromonas sp.]
MGFKQRLTLFTTGLVILAVALTTIVLAVNARRQLLTVAEAEGNIVALLLARSAGAAVQIPAAVEQVLDEQMVSQARLAAYYVAAAQQAGLSEEQINSQLRQLTASTAMDELWISDAHGHAVLNNLGLDFTFTADTRQQSQAAAFWPLLSGESSEVVQPAQPREIDGKMFKYVGVTGIDQPRIVQVGYEMGLFTQLNERIGLEYIIRQLVAGGDINAIWVVNRTMETIAHDSILGGDQRPDTTELKKMAEVYQANEPMSLLSSQNLTVMAPIPGTDGQPIGVTLVRLPTAHINATLQELVTNAVMVGLLVALIGTLVSLSVGRRMIRPVIALTDAAAEIEAGRFDAHTMQPVTERRDELGQLSQVFTRMAQQVQAREEDLDRQVKDRTRDLQQKNSELEYAHRTLQRELDAARAVQMAILPTEFPQHDRYQVYGRTIPAREMGGDFYDVFQIDANRLGLVVADVSGKGVPAAFFMAVARTELRGSAMTGLAPGQVLQRVNNILCRENPLELFVTVFYAILDVETGLLTYANGGHNPPLVTHVGEVTALPLCQGTALGVLPELDYLEKQHQLQPRDTVQFYTDGVTEAFDPNNEEFGETRLQAILAGQANRSAEELTAEIIAAVQTHAADAAQSDDITSLSLTYGNRQENSDESHITMTLTNDVSQLVALGDAVEKFSATIALDQTAIFQLNLVLDELVTNIITYAFPDGGDHPFTIELWGTHGGYRVRLQDDGVPFNPLEAPEPDLRSEAEQRDIGGLGIHFLRTLMDDVSYRRDAPFNVLEFTKKLH